MSGTTASRQDLRDLLLEAMKPAAEWAVERGTSTNHQAIDAQWREDVALARGRHRQAEHGRHRNRREWLTARRQELVRTRSVQELLHELSVEQGMTWVDMSRMLRVSVPALRKWRKAGGVSPENRDRLAGLVAFLQVLYEASVRDPAQWIAQPLVDGFTVTILDLYTPELAPEFVELGAGDVSSVMLLDRIEPQWRETYQSEYEVFSAEDGMPALRPRG
ncbi:hypothetical protein [Streptomyces sp. enrichment culture]|uniref:hypothetical protein n=1 Tax=Streptomyces sp. enrichment culture TaxID=1795815 RepID=UPI003F578E75